MQDIPFTQYMRPDGRKVEQFAPMPEGYEEKVKAILAAGLKFEAEVLTTGTVSLTISNGEEDIAIELSSNGPEVEKALIRLIDTGYKETTNVRS